MAAKNPKRPKSGYPEKGTQDERHEKRSKLNHLANLPDDLTISNIVQRDNCDEYFVTLTSPPNRVCPCCGSGNCVIKDSGRTQTVRHIENRQRGVIVTFHKRRLVCKDCQVTFFERLDWLHPALHITSALWVTICLDLTQLLSVATIARNHRVTPSVVSSVLDTIVYERPAILPETLGIDEFKGNSGEWDSERSRWNVEKMHCNISDGEAGFVIDVLPQITGEYLLKYFRQYSPDQRERVKYFCCDMHNGFISVAKQMFPQAHICIDLFHVVKLINDTIELIRRRLQRDMDEQQDKQKYGILKKAARSLLTSELKQEKRGNPNNAKRLEKLKSVFALFPELAEAYDAMQDFHRINAESQLILKKASLTDWIEKYRDSSIPELESLARRIQHWRGYLHNTWEYNRSNSTCEGLNNKIKVLKRISFGLHCFETFRKRVLLTCGAVRLANDPFTIFSEKRIGKGIKL